MTIISQTTRLNQPLPQAFISGLSASRLPLANVQSYYRSQSFTASSGTNPLVTAAMTFLVILQQLRQTTYYHDLSTLQQQLIHEMRAFESYAQHQNYRSDQILLARYILCASCDDVIQQTSWGATGSWDNYQLLALFHKETQGGDRFFVILDRLREDPAIYIDLLELMYLCLSLGFTGRYRNAANTTELDNLVEQLFELIRWQRGELKKNLLLQATPLTLSKPQPNTSISGKLIASLTSILLSSGYVMLSYLLGLAVSPLQQQLINLQQLTQSF